MKLSVTKTALVVSVESSMRSYVQYDNMQIRKERIIDAIDYLHEQAEIEESRIVILDNGRITMYCFNTAKHESRVIDEETEEGIATLAQAIDYLHDNCVDWKNHAASYLIRRRYALVEPNTGIVLKTDISPEWLHQYCVRNYGVDYDASKFEVMDTAMQWTKSIYGLTCDTFDPSSQIDTAIRLYNMGVHIEVIMGCFPVECIKAAGLIE